MGKVVNIEEVRTAIKNRQDVFSFSNSAEAKYRCEAYKELLDFLDTLSEEKQEDCPKIKGWIARDEKKNNLYIYENKPTRGQFSDEWMINGAGYLGIDNNLFPEITWDSEPIEVELNLHKL